MKSIRKPHKYYKYNKYPVELVKENEFELNQLLSDTSGTIFVVDKHNMPIQILGSPLYPNYSLLGLNEKQYDLYIRLTQKEVKNNLVNCKTQNTIEKS